MNVFLILVGGFWRLRFSLRKSKRLVSEILTMLAFQEEKSILSWYADLSNAEESFKKQKSRIKRLALGDQNTKFFHQKVSTHRERNKILSLLDDNGNRVEEPGAVNKLIVDFYVNFLGTKFD